MSRDIGTPASETQRLGLHGRVNTGHGTSMHSMDQLLREQAAAADRRQWASVAVNPPILITLQGRLNTFSKRRCMTRVSVHMAVGEMWPSARGV